MVRGLPTSSRSDRYPRPVRRGKTFPVVALVAALALAATFVAIERDGPSRPVVLRPDPTILPFQGMGVWVDLYDDAVWNHPAAAVADMAAHDVRTVFVETSNFKRPFPFVDKPAQAELIDAAHAEGIRIVAWYLPGFVDPAFDLKRSKAAIRFETPSGNGYDGFGLDIEAPDVRNVDRRTARLLSVSRRLRAWAGDEYPLGAITPSPRGMIKHPDYWPDFPYRELSAIYDAFLPMSYFTWHHPDSAGTHWYITQNIEIIRREVGSDHVPIHVIGGVAQDGATLDQARAFVHALRERGVIGGSYYTYTGVGPGDWPILQEIEANPVEDPALPVGPGAPAMGNVPGADTTHGTGVVFSVGGFAGDRVLTYDAFDAQRGEITIFVNWVARATVDPGPKDAWTGSRVLSLPDSALVDGARNFIAFVPTDPSRTWGVQGVSLARA
jgi:hypothetical protein